MTRLFFGDFLGNAVDLVSVKLAGGDRGIPMHFKPAVLTPTPQGTVVHAELLASFFRVISAFKMHWFIAIYQTIPSLSLYPSFPLTSLPYPGKLKIRTQISQGRTKR